MLSAEAGLAEHPGIESVDGRQLDLHQERVVDIAGGDDRLHAALQRRIAQSIDTHLHRLTGVDVRQVQLLDPDVQFQAAVVLQPQQRHARLGQLAQLGAADNDQASKGGGQSSLRQQGLNLGELGRRELDPLFSRREAVTGLVEAVFG